MLECQKETQKKTPRYMNERSKRFIRKPSDHYERLAQSRKSSMQQFAGNHYIKTPSASRKKLIIEQNQTFKKFASNYLPKEQIQINCIDIQQLSPIKQLKTKQNYVTKVQVLQKQLQLRNNQFETMRSQGQRIKKCLVQEKQKRRLLQYEKKQLNKQLGVLKKQHQKIQLQYKRLLKQKQYLIKQIEFLEKINFDQKTRTLQSYREKYLENQIEKLRNQMKKSKGQHQKKLQQEIIKLKQQKYTLQSHFKALKLANQCLNKQIIQNNQQYKDFILNSDQYIKLREKYKKFLDEYKELRTQYWSLKTKVDKSINNESSLLSITFSSCDDKSHIN